MRLAAILFFFVIAALAYLSIRKAHGLQLQYRQSYLPAYTLYLAGWNILVVLAVVQFVLVGAFLPARSSVLLATTPLFYTVAAITLYFFSSFMVQIAGHELRTPFKVVYAILWGSGALLIVIMGARSAPSISGYPVVLSVVQYLLRTATVCGWGLYLLFNLKKVDDPPERKFQRNFVIILLSAYALFDLSLKIRPFRFSDYLISSLQIGFNFPALFYLAHFLRQRSLERPFETGPPDLNSVLAPLGISPREAEIVGLILKGFSNKEIAGSLFISLDTVKKHTYNIYRKLGVQNRVQLSYFIQNRPQD